MSQPVFISHSSLDKETADQVCAVIEDRGVNCWIAPRDVPPGARYAEAILQALENCSAIVLVLSEHSNASEQVKNEVERAVSKKKEVFPLKIDAVTPSLELEYFITRRHWLDATSAPLDDLLDQMALPFKTRCQQRPVRPHPVPPRRHRHGRRRRRSRDKQNAVVGRKACLSLPALSCWR